MAIIKKRVFGYQEFNRGFGLLEEKSYLADSAELINSLYEKYGDEVWTYQKNIDENTTEYGITKDIHNGVTGYYEVTYTVTE